MHLFLDANAGKFALVEQDDSKEDDWTVISQEQSLVEEVGRTLQQEGLTISDVTDVHIIQGKGSFSQTREVVVFSNMLKILRNVKIHLYPQPDQVVDGYINADYYSEPNIST